VQSSNRQTSTVNVLKQYIDRAEQIVGERTPDEEKYDREVIRWLRRGKNINKAIAKANQKYPKEALQINEDNLADVEAHYEYLAEHEAIMEKLDVLKK
jgi:hypothetical protein